MHEFDIAGEALTEVPARFGTLGEISERCAVRVEPASTQFLHVCIDLLPCEGIGKVRPPTGRDYANDLIKQSPAARVHPLNSGMQAVLRVRAEFEQLGRQRVQIAVIAENAVQPARNGAWTTKLRGHSQNGSEPPAMLGPIERS